MSYNSSAYQKAINILERRREKAALEANARKAEILSRLPEIDEIQSKLSAIGISISKCFFNKDNNEAEIKKLEAASLALQRKREEILVKRERFTFSLQTGFFNLKFLTLLKYLLLAYL